MNNIRNVASRGHEAPANVRKIAVVVSVWHTRVSAGLLISATKILEAENCEFRVFHSPSAFDIPLIVQEILERSWDGVVVLSSIIQGSTDHYQHVSASVSTRLGVIALQTHKPVGYGILTVSNEAEALDRAGLPNSKEDRGREAAEWVLRSLDVLDEVRSS
ncbi:6,7-dimethyl-8-ribityllumazine synthase [Cryobacterium sp. MDB1-18-2]|nr:6,7-dimethyl-8-ribityllumazine synthase [Cryobacterium sp. MDB1-18-2]TFC46982.1 6,7-dimethyl-8-ribityllumazine synthase [Cryobacterium sp. MDB1-18-1]